MGAGDRQPGDAVCASKGVRLAVCEATPRETHAAGRPSRSTDLVRFPQRSQAAAISSARWAGAEFVILYIIRPPLVETLMLMMMLMMLLLLL